MFTVIRQRRGFARLLGLAAAGLALGEVGCDHRGPGAGGGVAVAAQKPVAASPEATKAPAASATAPTGPASTGTNAPAAAKPAVTYGYQVVNVWPHDRKAFTQGLVYWSGVLLESTGNYGQSTLRRVELQTGQVLQQVPLRPEYFGEGLALAGGKLFQLTWKHRKGFVYDLESFSQEREFRYDGEGWGLATDGQQLIMSDGTDRLRWLDPATAEVKRSVQVTHQGKPVAQLNELEYVEGEVFANVWGTDFVVRIDPATGGVVGIVDFRNLLPAEERQGVDVLNGIAYDAAEKRLFVTGKWWPKLFEVRLEAR